jgi:hypothetical protein
MMMDSNTMDPLTKEWWEIIRSDILEAIRARSLVSGGGGGGNIKDLA